MPKTFIYVGVVKPLQITVSIFHHTFALMCDFLCVSRLVSCKSPHNSEGVELGRKCVW